MRDIAREGPVSMGAIYLHFKNKAELLVEALETKISEDLEAVNPPGPVDHVERLTSAGREITARRELRALLVQAAAAAQTDDEARTRIREAQEAHVNDWIERYEADRERLELDRDLDLPTAVLYTWAAELGLGMLEAFGMDHSTQMTGPISRTGWHGASAFPKTRVRAEKGQRDAAVCVRGRLGSQPGLAVCSRSRPSRSAVVPLGCGRTRRASSVTSLSVVVSWPQHETFSCWATSG